MSFNQLKMLSNLLSFAVGQATKNRIIPEKISFQPNKHAVNSPLTAKNKLLPKVACCFLFYFNNLLALFQCVFFRFICPTKIADCVEYHNIAVIYHPTVTGLDCTFIVNKS